MRSLRWLAAFLAVAVPASSQSPAAPVPAAGERPVLWFFEWTFKHRYGLAERLSTGQEMCGRKPACDPLAEAGEFQMEGDEYFVQAICAIREGWLDCAIRWETACFCGRPARLHAMRLRLPRARVPEEPAMDPRMMWLSRYERSGAGAPAISFEAFGLPGAEAARFGLKDARTERLGRDETGLFNFLMRAMDDGDVSAFEAGDDEKRFCPWLPAGGDELLLARAQFAFCGGAAKPAQDDDSSHRYLEVTGVIRSSRLRNDCERSRAANRWFPAPEFTALRERLADRCAER